MNDPLLLAVEIGLLILTGVATAVSVWRAVAARDAESGAKKALKAAKESAAAAKEQANSAEVQAGAAVTAASSATRQATAAESRLLQTDTHRTDDRRADAIMALTRMLYREVEFAREMKLWSERAFLRFANGEELIRAYALVHKTDHDVVLWAAKKAERVREEVDRAQGEIAAASMAGPRRSAAARIAAESAQELLNWQRGDRDTASFTSDIESGI